MIAEAFQNSSVFAKIVMVIPVGVVALALAYAIKPTERRLALMRPLSLAAIFAALAGFTVGIASILNGIAAVADRQPVGWGDIAMGTSEAIVPLFGAFGCLTFAWLCVAIGMRRQP